MIRAHLELIMEVAVGPPAEHDYVRDEVPA
jgi:hypothetical protein